MKGRSTMAPKQTTSSSQRSSSAGRQTLMGIASKMNESQRAGSLVKSYWNSSSNQDAKVLVDKSSQENYMENIHDYMVCHKIDEAFEIKQLKLPSSKTFFGIFHFLLNTIDPYLLTKINLVDDKLPFMIKNIGYPYMLPKAVFVALTAPHSWPHMICLLSWMVDLIRYFEKFLKKDVTYGDQALKNLIELYILKSYLDNEEERFQKTSELLEKLDLKLNEFKEVIKDYDLKIETIKLNTKALKENQPELVDLEMKINILNNQHASEKDVKICLEKEKVNLKLTFEKNNEIFKRLEGSTSDLKQEIESIKKMVNNQEMNRDQEEKIKSEIVVQEQFKQMLLTQKNEKNKQMNQVSSKKEEIYLEIDMKMRELNEIIKKQQEIYSKFSTFTKDPNYQKLKENDYLLEEIKKNTTKNILKEIYPSNFKHSIAPQIGEMIKKANENKNKFQESSVKLQNEIDELEKKMKEYWDINRTYIENTRKLETEIALKKEQIQKDNAKFEEKSKCFQEETSNLKKKSEENYIKIEKYNESMNDAQNRLQNMQEEFESNKKYVESMKSQDMNKLLLLKNEVIQHLRTIEQAKRDYLQTFKQILNENNET